MQKVTLELPEDVFSALRRSPEEFANPGTAIIVDDLAARRCAATLGVPVRGTLGLI